MLRKLSDTKFTFKAESCLWFMDMYEPLTISFVALYHLEHPGRLLGIHSWLTGKAHCLIRIIRILELSEMICADLGCRELNGNVCHGARNRSCYVQGELDWFTGLTLANSEDSVLTIKPWLRKI